MTATSAIQRTIFAFSMVATADFFRPTRLDPLTFTTKPPKNNSNSSTVPDKPYYETQYDVLGGSVLTNFFRAQINISPIKDSRVFNFTLSKRFELAEWESPRQMFKWHEDHQQHLWVPASVAEAQEAKENNQDPRR